MRLDELARDNQSLYHAYLLKDWLQGILDGRQVNVARTRLTRWIEDARSAGLRHFARVAGTIEKHIDGVLVYVRTRMNNGRLEGLNGKARVITRRSYGLHSASALIAMLFLCCGGIETSAGHRVPKLTH